MPRPAPYPRPPASSVKPVLFLFPQACPSGSKPLKGLPISSEPVPKLTSPSGIYTLKCLLTAPKGAPQDSIPPTPDSRPRRPFRLPPAMPPRHAPFSGTPGAPSLRSQPRGPVKAAPLTLPCPEPHSLLSGPQRRWGEAILSGTDPSGPHRDPRAAADAASARNHAARRPGRPLGGHRDVERAEQMCGLAPLGGGRPPSPLLPALEGSRLRLRP